MDVEIVTEVAQFPEKEYINGVFLAVHPVLSYLLHHLTRALLRSIMSSPYLTDDDNV
jgi:hypothetical protein